MKNKMKLTSFFVGILLIFALFIALVPQPTAAAEAGDTFESDGLKYTITSENTVEVAFGNGAYTETTYVIPQTVSYDGTEYTVTALGQGAFTDCSALTSVTLPNSIHTIQYGAFADCPSLTSIILPNSVTTIEGYAFAGCTGLSSITIPNSVTTMGAYVFLDASNASIAISESEYSWSSKPGIDPTALISDPNLANPQIPVSYLYDIEYILTHLTASESSANGNLIIQLTADAGYHVPDPLFLKTIPTVKADGIELAVGVDYNYADGQITIDQKYAASAIQITAAATNRVHFHDFNSFDLEILVPTGSSLFDFAGDQGKEALLELQKPTQDGYIFNGWYTSPDGGQTFTGEAFDFSAPVTADIELYPKWTSIEDSNNSDNDSQDSSDLNDSDLNDSDLNDSDLNDSDLNDSDLNDSDLNDSDLNDSDLNDSNSSESSSNSSTPGNESSENSNAEDASSIPATGDANSALLWTVLLLISATVLTYIVSSARKTKQN